MLRRRGLLHAFFASFLIWPIALAGATETITYAYDEQGRLKSAASSGTVNNFETAEMTFDDADNRVSYDVTAQPTLTIGDAAVTEGGILSFTVTRTAGGAPTATFTASSGTATSGSDFTASTGTVSFLPSQMTQTIQIATTDDALPESSETMTVTLSAPGGGAKLGTPKVGTGTINDND